MEHNSEEYFKMIDLRMEVLLQPIGVPLSFIDQAKEEDDFLIGAFNQEELIACCILTPLQNNNVQLRQMAVNTEYQNKGYGKRMLQFAETFAIEKGYHFLVLHARETVTGFYQNSGYTFHGSAFEEVGMKHFKMKKNLR